MVVLVVVGFAWYAAVAVATPGFTWYTLVDNHILNVARGPLVVDEAYVDFAPEDALVAQLQQRIEELLPAI